jgi:hypothetical protein
MDFYLYSVEMPFTGVKLFYRELNSREQIYISKANVTLPLEPEFLEDYGRVLLDIVLNCVKNKEDFYKINLIEYVLFLCKLRIASIGEEIELMVSQEEAEEDEPSEKKQNIKLTLNLSTFMLQLYEIGKACFLDNVIETNDMEVYINWPNIKCENYFLSSKSTLFVLDSLPLYIEKIKIKDKIISLDSYELNQRNEIYDRFSVKLQNKIKEKILNAIKQFTEFKIFKGELSNYISFNFYNISYQNILRLLFSDNLKSIYQEYYVLASRNIPPNYIDSLTIGERKVYYSFLEKQMEQEETENLASGNGYETENIGMSDMP